MRRDHPTKLLRCLVAAVVALASFGPQATYAHTHPAASGGHHDYVGHDAPGHDDDDDDGPGLSDGVAHVHGAWLGFAITVPSPDGASAFDDSHSLAACPTLSADLGKGPFGPLKERVPWPELFVPPEPFPPSILAGLPAPNPLLSAAGTSHALAGRTLVLRC
jgi:hypothetical protein